MSLILSFSRIRLAAVPGFIKRARAREAAAREFMAQGLTRTRGRNGVLIYLARAEHYAQIIADIGLADRVETKVWEEIVADLIAAIKDDRAGEGLTDAVRRVGVILAQHAPPQHGDTDELANKIVFV